MVDDRAAFEALVHRVDPAGKLLQFWPLTGGVSAQVTALEVLRSDGQIQKMVVRQHGPVDLEQNPLIAADEFRLLQYLSAAAIPVPQPYHLEPAGELFSTPCLVIAYVDGQPDFHPAEVTVCVEQLATHLAQIHAIRDAPTHFPFLHTNHDWQTRMVQNQPARLDDSLDEGRIRDVLEAVWPLPVLNDPVLLHGDFWPGNVLWHAGKLAAIIDWEDASLGDPLADLANSRMEILWAYGVEAMQYFTHCYRAGAAMVDLTNLPYWDLCVALRPAFKIGEWAGDAATERRMREQHNWFVTQAFEQLT